jgi:hypothetical protein
MTMVQPVSSRVTRTVRCLPSALLLELALECDPPPLDELTLTELCAEPPLPLLTELLAEVPSP